MKAILDVCCGGKMFYFNKNNPNVLFCDIRREKHILCDKRIFEVNPDVICDFTNLPFEDNTFSVVVFDPPHLVQVGDKAYMAIKYGKLRGDWRETLNKGFNECMRVCRPGGVIVFKWSEIQISVKEVIKIFGREPLLGNKNPRQKSGTHWLLFYKDQAAEK